MFPEYLMFPPTTRYIVISDSELRDIRVRKAEEDIAILESQANRLNTALAEVKNSIRLKEAYIKKAGIPNESKATEALSSSGESSDQETSTEGA